MSWKPIGKTVRRIEVSIGMSIHSRLHLHAQVRIELLLFSGKKSESLFEDSGSMRVRHCREAVCCGETLSWVKLALE